jgi:PAS domain S-box-containing protein
MTSDPKFIEFPEGVSDTFILIDDQWRFVYLNRRALQQAQMPLEKIVGQRLWDLYPGLLGTAIESAYRTAMDERTTAYLEHPGIISGAWYGIHVYPMRDGIAIYGRDITDRKHVERALRESEERIRSQYENLPMPTYTWRQEDGTFRLITFNKAATDFTGGAIRFLVGKTTEQLYQDEPEYEQAMRLACERQAPIHREMRYIMRSTAQTKELDVTYVFVPPDLVMVHTQDITDRKRAEHALQELNQTLENRATERMAQLQAKTEELTRSEQALRVSESHYRELAEQHRLLALELEHRVGNNIAGLISLVMLMRERASNVREYADAIESRLHAMAQVHRLLTSSGWKSVELPSLIQSVLGVMQDLSPHPIRTEINGSESSLAPRQAFALALILAEWFTNSCKYGVHSASGGSLLIDWAAIDERKSVRMRWIERGGPAITEPVRPSLGMQLTHDLSVRELRGRCTMTFPREGAEHEIEFTPT